MGRGWWLLPLAWWAWVSLGAAEVGVAADAAPTETVAPPLVLPLRAASAPPVIAVLALNEGTETTDFLVPYAVLRQAQVGVVEAVAPQPGPVALMPALEVEGVRDFASFDSAYPAGADIVVVPAMHRDDDPAVRAWLQRQAAQGAVVVAVCSGALVVGQAGLLEGRRFTGHWYDRGTLQRRHAGAAYVPGLRYLADGPVVTTTGVSASLPVSLALVEALVGTSQARAVADAWGLRSWQVAHRSDRFGLGPAHLWTLAANAALFWRHERIELPVADGADDVALAFAADAWSRSYRSQAVAVNPQAPGQPVRLRSGLTLRVVLPQDAAVPAAVPDVPPACALRASLRAIGQRYGDGTRQWVATQLEYDEVQDDCIVPAATP